MTEENNVALAEHAWSHCHVKSPRRPSDFQPFFDTLADDVVFKVAGASDPALATFRPELRGKQAVIEKFLAIDPAAIDENDLEDPVTRPLEFVGAGDRVVMLGSQRYTLKRYGLTVRDKAFAVVMDFRDGLIVRVLVIEDMSELAVASVRR